MKIKEKNYIVFWLSQSVSQLGSAMTSFALVLWAYEQTDSAMTVSVMTFFNYIPYIIVSLFAGSIVDRHRKKNILLLSDSVAGICSLAILIAWKENVLSIGIIYIVNAVIGFMNSFQAPAEQVAIGKMVPKEKLSQISGLNSFSSNLITALSPVFAAAMYSVIGLEGILFVDLGSFLIAVTVIFIWITIPEQIDKTQKNEPILSGCKIGLSYLWENKGLWYIVLTMAVLNFLSRLTYENILSPMILARSGKNEMALAAVNAAIGIGGILGGILVSIRRKPKNKVGVMYRSAAISFLFGDFLMAVGRNPLIWCFAGAAASLPIPFVMAAQTVILYERIPEEIQGRVFAVRNAIQFSTIPVGILLGGWLADYVFEPMMMGNGGIKDVLHFLVGTGEGSGMAVMFLCTSCLGSIFSFWIANKKEMKQLR